MIINLSPGDVFRDVLSNFRESPRLVITFKTEWDWGHMCQIEGSSIDHYPADYELKFDHCPKLNIANAALNGDMIIEIKRQ